MYQLKWNQQHAILTLHQRGWSPRAIARELELNRETVGKYLRAQAASIAAAAGTGEASEPAISTPGANAATNPKPTIATAGSVAGRKSSCAACERGLKGITP